MIDRVKTALTNLHVQVSPSSSFLALPLTMRRLYRPTNDSSTISPTKLQIRQRLLHLTSTALVII